MRHNQGWRSQEEKIEAGSSFCDLSLEVKLEGIRLRLQEEVFDKRGPLEVSGEERKESVSQLSYPGYIDIMNR